MGFYGNITNTSKTTFSFDLIYTTRADMELNANLDGVFLGRYVLIDYGEAPIKGYYNPDTKLFYNTANFHVSTEITGNVNFIYQDLHNALGGNSFYVFDGNIYRPLTGVNDVTTPYQWRFQQDVKAYGRGYDSTAWVKRYDVNTKTYKYVMVAELNAVVPTFHMVVNPPNAIPVTPYFDRDTTNMDYYLHMQSDFGSRIKKIQGNMKSDEQATRIMADWVKDNDTGVQSYQERLESIPADIYYNNAGFDYKIRNFSQGTVTYNLTDDDGKPIIGDNQQPISKTIDYSKNSIGYDMGQSGRLYGADADLGVYTEGQPANDVYDWYFRLPGIGNAICKMWDKVYGEVNNGQTRYINRALVRGDTKDHYVTYDKNTLIGMINTTQDILGYYFVPTDDTHKENHVIENKNTSVTIVLNQDNNITSYAATYPALNCLFYTPVDPGQPITQYFHYAYTPDYEPAVPTDKTLTYYYKDEKGIFHIANIATYQALNADNETIPYYDTYYTRKDKWTLVPLENEVEDSIYALIAEIHNIIGTNANDVRNLQTMNGTINIIKDIIANIDTQLLPGKLLKTSDNGVIQTSNTYFPSATWDRDEVLDGNGNWVSRFATVKVLTNSGNANQVAPEVNTIIDGAEQNVAKTIVSDNDKSNYGTSLVNSKKHTTNNLTLGTRNKWIQLHGNEDKDSIEFKHLESPIIGRLRSEQAEGSEYLNMYNGVDANGNVVLQDSTKFANFSTNADATEIKVEPTTATLAYVKGTNDQDDNRLTIPYIVADNAGHIVELGTKNFNIPNTYKHITLTPQSTNENFIETNDGNLEADTLTDRLTFSTGNQWIEARIDEDQLTFAHAPIDKNATVNWEFKASAIETDTGVQSPNWEKAKADGNELTIPSFTIDNAGHVVGNEVTKFYVPNNFRNISVNDMPEGKETADATQKADTLEASSVVDTWSIAPQNKWLKISAEKNQDLITIGHTHSDLKAWQFNPSATAGLTTTTLSQDNSFTIPTFETDNAGHIIKANSVTYYIPNTFRTISIAGQSKNETAMTPSASTGNIDADSTTDTFTIATANKWIQTMSDLTNDKVTFAHSLSGVAANTYGTNDATALAPNFGSTFEVPGYHVDAAGHITSATTHTVKIPQMNLQKSTSVENANVLTGIELNQTSGMITISQQNIGTLLLTGYTLPNLKTATITASDTLHSAIQKLENQVYTETIAREQAISAEKTARENAISAEKTARENAFTNLRVFKTVTINGTAIEANNNQATLAITSNNNAIVLSPVTANNSFSIEHKTYTAKSNKLYKITVDEWGHVSNTAEATSTDIGLGKVENKSVAEIVAEITSRFSMKLNAPQLGGTENGATFTVLVNNMDAKSTYEYKWTKQGSATVLSTGSSYTATDTEVGTHTYICTVTRSYGGAVSDAVSRTYSYTIEPPPVVEDPETGEGTE